MSATSRPCTARGGNFGTLDPKMNFDDLREKARRRARWMAEAQRGEARAYADLLNDVGPMVMRYLRRRVHDSDDVQDLYQDVFMAVHRARHTYEPGRPLEPWLFGIAHHVLADHRRKALARRVHEVLVAFPPDTGVQADVHLKPQLAQALRTLSAEQRQAIDLIRIEGLPIGAAAARAGTTIGALKVRVHRAYKALRRLL